MRYAQIRKFDVANGLGIRTTIFVTGCTHNCFNCFNKEYQDFNFGKVWTDRETQQVIEYVNLPMVKGLSILGGEPMQNAKELFPIIQEIRNNMPKEKDIWLWSGYTLGSILENQDKTLLLSQVDVLVDGLFIQEKKDLSLKFRGSSNQRIIDVKQTLTNGEVVLYNI